MTVKKFDEHQEKQQLAEKIYNENQESIRELDPELQKFFKDCQLYFYTSVEPSIEIDHELKSLVKQLYQAQNRNLTAEEILGMDGEDYCKQTLRKLNVAYYRHDITFYSKYIILFFVFTFTVYTVFEFFHGLIYYGSLSDAFGMPVPISLLGLPLQILTLFTGIFFLFQFRRRISFGSAWHKDNNLLYLLASTGACLASLVIPFISLYYSVFVIRFPVWLMTLVLIFAYLYLYVFPRINIDKYLDHHIRHKTAAANTQTEQIERNQDNTSAVAIRENDQKAAVHDTDSPYIKPKPAKNLWETIRTAGPLITRQTYREAKKQLTKESKEKKDDK